MHGEIHFESTEELAEFLREFVGSTAQFVVRKAAPKGPARKRDEHGALPSFVVEVTS